MRQSATQTRSRPVAARRAINLVFWASGFDMGTWASQIPRIKASLELTDSGLAMIVLCFAIGAILTMPITGALTTRFGGVRVVVAAGAASAVSLGLLGAAPDYAWLLAATLLTGCTISALDVAMNTQATVIERAWGGPIMSGIHGWFSLGGLAGTLAGGALIQAQVSFQTVLLITGAQQFAAVVGAASWMAVAGATAAGPGFAWPRRAVLGIGMLCLLAFLFEGGVFDWLGVYMHEVAGAPLGFASAGLSGFNLSMALMRFAGDAVTRRLGPMRVLIASAGLAACGIALACAIPTPLAVTVGLTLAGLGQANIVPLLFSAAGRVPGVAAGAGVAMAATMGYGAFLLGPSVIGVLADAFGLRLALLVLVGCALAIGASARAAVSRSV